MVKNFRIIRKVQKAISNKRGFWKGYLKTRSTIVPKARQVAEGELEYGMNFDVIPKRLWKSGNCQVQPHRGRHTELIIKGSFEPFQTNKDYKRFQSILKCLVLL